MRCGCPECEAFMIHADEGRSACVCPECGYRCTACLGTNSVVTKDKLKTLQNDPRFQAENFDFSLWDQEQE